jgi:hypothetical protein
MSMNHIRLTWSATKGCHYVCHSPITSGDCLLTEAPLLMNCYHHEKDYELTTVLENKVKVNQIHSVLTTRCFRVGCYKAISTVSQ